MDEEAAETLLAHREAASDFISASASEGWVVDLLQVLLGRFLFPPDAAVTGSETDGEESKEREQ